MPDEIIARERSDDDTRRYRWERDKMKRLFRDATVERNAAREEAARLAAELAEAKKAEAAVAELAALKAQVKLEKHRGKFNELAKAAGCKDKALDDLWEKSGYNALGDVPDEAAINAAIKKQQTERDYLFEPPSGEGDQGGQHPADMLPEPELVRPGPGRGRGGNAPANGTQMQVTDAQLRDPAWCFANAAKLQQVAKDVANLPVNQVGNKFTIL